MAEARSLADIKLDNAYKFGAGRYLQEAGALNLLGGEVARLGKKALVIAGPRAWAATEGKAEKSLKDAGVEFELSLYPDQNTYERAKEHALQALTTGCQVIVGVGGGRIGEGMLSVTAGLSFNLNRRGFKRASQAQTVDYTSYLDRIKRLENTNNELASQNSELSDENEKLRNMPPKVVAEQKVSASPVALFFKIGKATLDKKEQTNLEFYVRNAMKADKDKTFTLIGSADKDTGTKEINQRLSEQRMEYVYNLLKDKYGIDPSRLVKKAEGDTNNRFAEPELNRVVIVE